MNDFDDLDDVFGPLRSAATPAELAAESAIVDAMARNHRHTKGSTMFSSRRARVAAFVAAGVIGFGGVAAAGPGGPLSLTGSGDTTTTSEVTTTTVEDDMLDDENENEKIEDEKIEELEKVAEVEKVEEPEITKSVIEEVDDDEVWDPQDDMNTDFNEEFCLEGNHGKTVSAAARGDEEYLEQIPEGTVYTQSQVAQSSCGKDYEVVDDDEVGLEKTDADSDDNDDDSDDEKKKPARADKPGKPDHAGKQGKGPKGKKG